MNLEAGARYLYQCAKYHGWDSQAFAKQFEEFRSTDPIGYDEWLAIIERIVKCVNEKC